MRYFIEISFNGTHYHGWQRQPDAISIQEVVENALTTVLQKPLQIVGAGRTDAGVHAKQLFAHFDFDEIKDVSDLQFKLNSFLPKDIAIKSMFEVNPEAHARFNATQREYKYFITLKKDPFLQNRAYQLHYKPDIVKMNEAAKRLLSYKDFQCFSRSNTDVKTYYCTVKKAQWEEKDETFIFTISADRFLRNMVRAIVGTLLDIGFNKTSLSEFESIIKSNDRTKAGASAPAHGLYLTRVFYPETIKK